MHNSVQLEDVSCPLGCEVSDADVLTGHDRLHDLPGEFTVVKCRACGLMRTNPRPTANSIGFYYPDDYGPYLGTRVQQNSYKDTNGIKDFFRPFVQWVFNSKVTALPSLSPGRLLEVGCASGSFLHKMACEGWQVEGIEFSETAAQTARQQGYHVHTGSLENAPTPAHPFDLIVGWMVLEHLHHPVASLKKLHTWAKPGAWLALSVPDAGALEFRIFKNKWYDLHLPNHLYHFTPDTLGQVLEAGGWRLTQVHHQRNLNNLFASIAYALEDKGFSRLGKCFRGLAGLSGIWVYVLFPLACLFGIFKQSGRMTIWARKID